MCERVAPIGHGAVVMSEHQQGGWGAQETMWWQGGIAADHQQQLYQQAASTSENTNTHQHFSYKMANTFQNPQTTESNVATGPRGYDYRPADGMTGGNPPMNVPAPAAQWWYPPSTMDNMHSLPGMQNNMQQQHNVQHPPVHSPPPTVSAIFLAGCKDS